MAKKFEGLREDIAAAVSNLPSAAGSGREIRNLEGHLWDGEKVEMVLSGKYGPGIGLLTLTDRRLLFTKDGVMSSTSEDFPIDKISSVQWSSGMIFGKLTIFVSGNKAQIENVDKQMGKQLTDSVRDRINSPSSAQAATSPATPPAAGGDDVIEQIRKLKELHEAGVLTDEEFSAKKAELLNRI